MSNDHHEQMIIIMNYIIIIMARVMIIMTHMIIAMTHIIMIKIILMISIFLFC